MSVMERGMFKKRKIDEMGSIGGGSSGSDKITEIAEAQETTQDVAKKGSSLGRHDFTVCKHILDVCFRRGIPCDGASLAQLGGMYDAFKNIASAPTEKGKEPVATGVNVGMIMLMIQFIDAAAKAGTINAKEMKLVGHVYGNLEAFMAYQASQQQPATSEPTSMDS